MGNTKSNRSSLEMKRLEEITGIPRQTFIDMHENIKRKSGTEGGTVLVSRADARHEINQTGVGYNNQKQVDAAFGFFEENGNFTTEELFSIIVMLAETMDGVNRLSYVVDTHNPKGADSENVSRKYGQRILECITEFYGIKNADKPEHVWVALCGGTDKAKVTREHFVKYVTSTDPYQDFLI
ncbi:unnamed protein product [Adineta steineri]|uniref:Uncharacterized protein n=1 Tax=Adineta steineri TaxID=433720 RepID=A0A814A8Q8_9BILA|nr:unnamed protein product [Adineta steineri]CAF1149619.1 unnamed protein product [Adineta steineri]CAF1151403.1 unnamed protein product [Adineta steineri]